MWAMYMRNRTYSEFVGWEGFQDFLSRYEYGQCTVTGLYGSISSGDIVDPEFIGERIIPDAEVELEYMCDVLGWKAYRRRDDYVVDNIVWRIQTSRSKKQWREFSTNTITKQSAFERVYKFVYNAYMKL